MVKKRRCVSCGKKPTSQCERQHQPFRVAVVWHSRFAVQTRVYELNRTSVLVCPLGCNELWPPETDHTFVARHVEQHTEIVLQAQSSTKFARVKKVVGRTVSNGADHALHPLGSNLRGTPEVNADTYYDNLACGSLQDAYEGRLPSDSIQTSTNDLHYSTRPWLIPVSTCDEVGFASPLRVFRAPEPYLVEDFLSGMDGTDEDFPPSPPTVNSIVDCNPVEEQCEGEQSLAHNEESPASETIIDLQASGLGGINPCLTQLLSFRSVRNAIRALRSPNSQPVIFVLTRAAFPSNTPTGTTTIQRWPVDTRTSCSIVTSSVVPRFDRDERYWTISSC
ncbi:hypothetical protein DFH06DRAFT_1144178 [Mycena polygramma]|nr:hypothetical protein DFH06DRAFT_1144178 [Mycena polygramma]